MATSNRPKPAARMWDDPRIVFPSEEAWAEMSEREQDAFIERVYAVAEEYRGAMSEGVRHFRRKAGAGADLDAHFRRAGRGVFVACELGVFYPNEPMIVPDVLAVMDCDPDIEPESWVVAREKRGIDVVIEVRNLGRKHKDVVENVSDYARLRIPEYFSYDCRRGTLSGWRLSAPKSQTYKSMVPQHGFFQSEVLGLDLALVDKRLRFFTNGALVPSAPELAERLQRMVDDQRGAREEAEEERDRAQERFEHSLEALRLGVLQQCELRGVSLSSAQRARLDAESDPGVLVRWLGRAVSVTDGDGVFEDG